MNSPPRFKYIGSNDHTGYAQAASALVGAMGSAGMQVLWESVQRAFQPGRYSADWAPDAAIVHTVPEYYPQYVRREREAGALRVVGHTVWETDRLPSHWPALINLMDAVIVPTEWNRDVFRQSGVQIPVIVTPHIPKPLQPALPQDVYFMRRRIPGLDGRRVFYSISAWQQRKGIDFLVEAFCEAFSADDPVALVIKSTLLNVDSMLLESGAPQRVLSRPQLEAMVHKAQARLGRAAPPVHLIVEDLSDADLQALHAIGDCFVSLTRGEGWGLGAFDAARQGKPVVTTRWGGTLAYLNSQSAYLVNARLTPVKLDVPNPVYTPDQHWAEPIHADAVKALRAVFEQPQEAAMRGQRAFQQIRQQLQPVSIAREMSAHLLQLPVRTSGQKP